MSILTLAEAKQMLRVTHDEDDALIQRLIDGAEDEALQIIDADTLPTEIDEGESPPVDRLPGSVQNAVYLLIEAGYLKLAPADVDLRRKRAETLLWPYRGRLGV